MIIKRTLSTANMKRLEDDFGFLIIVVSNQSGITRGLISSEELDKVNSRVNEILQESQTKIDSFYYCPYHPDFDSQEKCKCRKPSPELVFKVAGDHDIDLTKSFFVGDRISDVECGKNADINSILVTNTILDAELIELKKSKKSPNFIADNFLDVINYIESNIDGEIFEN